MKRSLYIATTVAIASCTTLSTGPAPDADKPTVATAASASALHPIEANGKLVEVPLVGSKQVAFRVAFLTGSADDPPGKEGLTALTAKLIAEGGTKATPYEALLRALYPMAAEISVSVDKEMTVFSGLVHVDHADKYAAILADVLKHPGLGPDDLERIRVDLINDIDKRLRATDDENLGKEMLNLMLYGDWRGTGAAGDPGGADHPYGHPTHGTLAGLKTITLQDVQDHRAKKFGRARMIVGLGGELTDALRARVTNAVNSMAAGDPPRSPVPAPRKAAGMQVLIAQKPGKAVAISMGYPHAVLRGHPDAAALALVQSYFGEHRQFHGVLMNEMRGLRGLNYGDYAYVENFVQEGWSRLAKTNIPRHRQHFEIWIRPVDPGDALFSIRLALFYLDRLVQDGLTDEDVVEIRTFLDGYTRLWDLTADRKLGHAIDDHFYGTPTRLATFRSDLRKLTAASVNAALRRHIVARPLSIAIVAPDAEGLKAALLQSKTSTKTYDAKVEASVTDDDPKVHGLALDIDPANVRVVPVGELFER